MTNNNPTAFIMVGLPGSGKSTMVNRFVIGNPDTFVASLDNILERFAKEENISYGESFKLHVKEASDELEKSISEAIASGLNIIFDQTNLTELGRRRRIAQLKNSDYNYRIIAQVITIEDSILEQRLINREKETGKHIPQDVIKNMKKSFVLPSTEEGFYYIDTYHFRQGFNNIQVGGPPNRTYS